MKLFLSYIRGVSEKLEKVCPPLGDNPIFKPQNILRNMLMHVKGKIRKEPHSMNLDCGLHQSLVWNPFLDPT